VDPTEREWQARARLSLHFAARVLGGEANLTAGYQQLVMSAFIPFFGPPTRWPRSPSWLSPTRSGGSGSRTGS